MPIIDHSTVRMPEVRNHRRERTLISSDHGAESLTVQEYEVHPGWEGRLHTHTTDIAVMITAGAVQMMVGEEVRTVRAGSTMLAPPGVPHKLINRLWIPARMLVIYPASHLETSYLE